MLLLICGGVVAVYLLLWVTVVKIPKCKSTTKLHGKTVIVTGKCFYSFSSDRLSCLCVFVDQYVFCKQNCCTS